MSLDVGLRRAGLRADPACEFLLHWVNAINVPCEGAVAAERLAAVLTGVRSLPCMDQHVVLEVGQLTEDVVADAALEWFLIVVDAHVDLPVGLATARLVADLTIEDFPWRAAFKHKRITMFKRQWTLLVFAENKC